MTEHATNTETLFWELDEELGPLELMARPGGPDLYTVRLKTHTPTSPYHATRELYPLKCDGTEQEVFGKAYILVPDFTVTVGLYPAERTGPAGAIGEVTSSDWQGMRHHEIASVRGLYYQEDQSLAIWEVDGFGRLDPFANAQLWQLFEGWLVKRFPEARQLYTDDAEPGETPEENREFLTGLGYQHVSGTHRIFRKGVTR